MENASAREHRRRAAAGRSGIRGVGVGMNVFVMTCDAAIPGVGMAY